MSSLRSTDTVTTVTSLLSANADPSAMCSHGLSPLHVASASFDVELVKLLAHAGAQNNNNDNNNNNNNNTTTINTNNNNDDDTTTTQSSKMLAAIAFKKKPTFFDSKKTSWPLDKVSSRTDQQQQHQQQQQQQHQQHHKHNSLPLFKSNTVLGLSPVHVAILRSKELQFRHDDVVQTIRCLLETSAFLLHEPDIHGLTPLHIAALYGHVSFVEMFVSMGADLNARTNGRETALHLATGASHINVITTLIKLGCDINVIDDEGSTAAHYCCRRGDIEILNLLMSTPGFKCITTVNMYRDTPLHDACYFGRVELLDLLLNAKMLTIPDDLLRQNMYGETVLHAAATHGRSPQMIATLLTVGCVPVNIRGHDGHTPLHSACWHGHIETAFELLQHGGDILIETDDGETCAHWCHQQGHDELLAALMRWAQQSNTLEEFQSLANNTPHDPLQKKQPSLHKQIMELSLPSPMGKVKNQIEAKSTITRTKSLLPPKFEIKFKRINRLDQVGAGSFAKVWRSKLDQIHVVALKQYKESHFNRKSNIDLFCREVEIHSKLEHPNILQFVGAVLEDPSRYCIVTAFMEGGTLYDALHVKRISIDFTLRVAIGQGMAAGMSHLHELKVPVIHRDLNSHNVLLSNKLTPVIADFGESRQIKGRQKAIPRVAKNMTLQPGNLRWMAPEVFQQNALYSLNADVFSYGLVLWETVTGEIPFHKLEPAAAAAQMAYHGQRPFIPPSCPPPISSVLHGCWQADADTRPKLVDIAAWFGYKYYSHLPQYTDKLAAQPETVRESNNRRLEAIFGNKRSVQSSPTTTAKKTLKPPPQQAYDGTDV